MNIVLLVVSIYMLLMLAIGFFFKKKADSPSGYYLSGRSLPTAVLIFTFAATWIGASATLGKAGLAYTSGISAISPTIGSFIAFFIFSAFAGRIRKIGAEYDIASIPDLFYSRFGKAASLIAAAVIAWTLIGTTGTQLIAFSKVLEFIFKPYGISYGEALAFSVLIVVAYTVLSGMYGVAYTDVIQGLILLIVIGAIVPFAAISSAGGMEGLHASLDPDYFKFSPSASMIGYTVTSFLYFVAGPPYWQRAFAAKSSKAAQRGALGGNIMIILYTISVVMIGISAAAIYPNVTAHETDMVLLLLVRDCFSPFLYALTVAAVLAVIMSTTDSYLILAAQTLTSDIFVRLRGEKDSKKIIRLSRISVVVVGALSLVFALRMQNIFQALMLSMSHFAAAVAIPALAALFSRKVTKPAVISSMLSGLVFSLLWSGVLNTPWGLSDTIAGSLMSLLVIIVVSLFTQGGEKTPFFE